MVEHLDLVGVLVLVRPKLMVALEQRQEVTVTVVVLVSVKELVKLLAPDLEREQIVLAVIMDLIENYAETTENFTMVLVAWEVQKQDLNRRSLEEVTLEVAEEEAVLLIPAGREAQFRKVEEKVLDHQEVLDSAITKDLVKVRDMPSWVGMVTLRWLVALEVVEV